MAQAFSEFKMSDDTENEELFCMGHRMMPSKTKN